MIPAFLGEKIVFSTSKQLNKKMPIWSGCLKGKTKRYRDVQFTERTLILHPIHQLNVFLHTPKAMLASHERPIKYNYF